MHAQHIRMKMHIPCETQRERETDRQTERERERESNKYVKICLQDINVCGKPLPSRTVTCIWTVSCKKINQRSLIRTIAVRLKGHLILQTILINNKGPSHMQMVWLSYLGKSTEYTFSCGTAIMYQ